jgi:glycosyltransferase involved in cell wall biosynthesis
MLAEQNYPNFEIVLIDDASSDSTLDIFEDFENYTQYPFGKSRNNEAFWAIRNTR